MRASASPGQPSASSRCLTPGFSRVCAWLAMTLLTSAARGAAQEPVAAVWKEHELVFTYRSSIALYTCGALQDRVASILRAVGARPDLQIKVTHCSTSVVPTTDPHSDPRSWLPQDARFPQDTRTGSPLDRRPDREQSTVVRTRVRMPVEVTPDVMKEIERDKSRRELIARATGNPSAKFDDLVAFPAERRVVTLNYRTAGIEAIECELLDQMTSSVFRDLGIRVVRRGFTCDRLQASQIRPELDVEALLPVQYDPGIELLRPRKGDEAGDTATPETTSDGQLEPPATDQSPD